jgi:hypothetical protein
MEALSPSVFVTLFFKFSGSADFFEKKEQNFFSFFAYFMHEKKTRLWPTITIHTRVNYQMISK